MMTAVWLEKHRPQWERLRELTKQAQNHGLRRMSAADLRELAVLYRQATADLARLRQEPDAELYSAPLNALLAGAHAWVYAGRPARKRDPWRFYRDIYPRVFRPCRGCILLAAGMLLLGAIVGAVAARQNSGFIRSMTPPNVRAAIRRHRMWTTSVVAVSPEASSGIMTNNLTVSFLAYAFGIGAGVGTFYLMFFNGLLLGVIGVACAQHGISLALWSFVAPHGVLELPAVCIAGGAGLRLAQGFLFPGQLPRGRSLARAGYESTRLLLGVVPMLFLAGIIEAFISPQPWPVILKFSIAAVLCSAEILYFHGLWAE